MDVIAGRICTEGIARKQESIEHYRVKGCITEESFRVDHQGQCDFGEERGTEACRIQKFPDNLKKYLPKKATQFYHKPVSRLRRFVNA